MKIGIIRETKVPEDNRVALIPKQVKQIQNLYPDIEIQVQASPTRAFSDEEYMSEGITVLEDVSDCDILLGIKEANIDSIIPGKHYIFFGHIAKCQAYNKPLLLSMLDKGITFTDWEYLVDDNNQRLIAFGWYAGVVGVYYTLRGWGLKTGKFSLPKPDKHFSREHIIALLKDVDLSGLSILVTGSGRVSHGAQYILESIGARKLSVEEYLHSWNNNDLIYTVANKQDLVSTIDCNCMFDSEEFISHPERYKSNFGRFAKHTDILLSCHFWGQNQPVYLTREIMQTPECRIKMVGDITCDIDGSIKSTVRSSTHAQPYYDYNPLTGKEEVAFSNPENISVMAVDTCPNALPRETSEFFGAKFIDEILPSLIADSENSVIIDRASIVKRGKINTPFKYLEDYVNSDINH